MADKHPQTEDDAAAPKRRSNRPHYDPAKEAPSSQRQPKAAASTLQPPIRGPPQPEEPARFLTKRQVLARVGVTYPCVWKWMNEGKFPRSRAVGGKSAWLESEVSDWINSRPLRRLKCDGPEAA